MENLIKISVCAFAIIFFGCSSKSNEPAITAGLRIVNQNGGTDLNDNTRTEIYNTSTGEYKSLKFFVLDSFGDTIKSEAEVKNVTFKGNVPFLRTILDPDKYAATLIIYQQEEFKGKSNLVKVPFEVKGI